MIEALPRAVNLPTMPTRHRVAAIPVDTLPTIATVQAPGSGPGAIASAYRRRTHTLQAFTYPSRGVATLRTVRPGVYRLACAYVKYARADVSLISTRAGHDISCFPCHYLVAAERSDSDARQASISRRARKFGTTAPPGRCGFPGAVAVRPRWRRLVERAPVRPGSRGGAARGGRARPFAGDSAPTSR